MSLKSTWIQDTNFNWVFVRISSAKFSKLLTGLLQKDLPDRPRFMLSFALLLLLLLLLLLFELLLMLLRMLTMVLRVIREKAAKDEMEKQSWPNSRLAVTTSSSIWNICETLRTVGWCLLSTVYLSLGLLCLYLSPSVQSQRHIFHPKCSIYSCAHTRGYNVPTGA